MAIRSAVLGDNLVDSLVDDVVDGLRDELHPEFGVRAYKLEIVTRTWPSGTEGVGQMVETAHEVYPQPLVKIWDGYRFTQKPCGIDDIGVIQLTEVSLKYTEADIIGDGADATQSLWRLSDAHGQLTSSKYFVVDGSPYIDRIQDIGWVVRLRAAGASNG